MTVTQQYGTTQVCEYRMTQAEVNVLVCENIAQRCDPSYDFDTKNPLLLRTEQGDYIVRFVQKQVTHDSSKRIENLMPIKEKKK